MCTGSHPYIPVENVAQVNLVLSMSGEVAENVFHVHQAGAFAPADLANIANLFHGWWGNKIGPLVTAACSLVEIRVVDLTTQTSGAYDTGVTGMSGTASGEALPNNVAALISWGTANRGKSFRGRTYIGGLASTDFTQNQLNDAAQSALADAGNSLKTSVDDGGYELGIVSYCSNKVWRTAGIFTPVVSLTAEKKLRSQRRRMPR